MSFSVYLTIYQKLSLENVDKNFRKRVKSTVRIFERRLKFQETSVFSFVNMRIGYSALIFF